MNIDSTSTLLQRLKAIDLELDLELTAILRADRREQGRVGSPHQIELDFEGAAQSA